MINIKSNKGITIVSLIIAVIILLILSSVIIHNVNLSNDVSRYNNMITDIELLKDKILIYYNNYGEIPKAGRTINIEGIDYYEIDLTKLDNITLKYGSENGQAGDLTNNSSDVYVVNDKLEIYYLEGAEKNGVTYHQ